MIQAYLVDLDGTLVDTRRANFLAYQAALAEVGVMVDQERFEREAFGKNWRQFLPSFLSEVSCCAEAASVAARKAELYKAAAKDIEVNSPLVELIRSRAKGIRAALVTSASLANVGAVIGAKTELHGLFDLMITGDDVQHHKPDPEPYLIATNKLGVHPSECVVFEDSEVGVLSATAAGCPVIRVAF